MLNRAQQPSIKITENINIPRPEFINLNNGSQLLVINEGNVDVCRVDIIFDAGSRYQSKKLEAVATTLLLPEGTAKYNSHQIAEYFDFWGSFIGASADKDFAKITAFSLTKHLDQTLERLEHIVKEPTYPTKEIDLWTSRGKQNLTVELDKTETLARIELFKSIYGENHPYGMFAMPTDYDKISRDNLLNFHTNNLGSKGTTIVLSGKVNKNQINTLVKHFGETPWGKSKDNSTLIEPSNPTLGKVFVSKPDALQSAIRIGREICQRSHPDFTDLSIVNTILGGYFGSRLMKNIREDKGYTYGIGSYLVSLRDSTMLAISAEVGAKYTKDALTEIWKEINRLKTEVVPLSEISKIQSHLMGEVLRSFNGPFATANSLIGLISYNNLDYTLHDRLIKSIKHITQKRIMELANKWFNKDLMVECVVGPENPF
ncbi:MAG TPA: hypothetical protein DG754_12900 [Bacteroidales bacterium]|jgi:predicted Zn-dependent peptidase|nr:hypothetical protein [Bacteroidales bacterium]